MITSKQAVLQIISIMNLREIEKYDRNEWKYVLVEVIRTVDQWRHLNSEEVLDAIEDIIFDNGNCN